MYQNTLFSTKIAKEEQLRVLPDDIKRQWEKDFENSPEFIDWEPIILTSKKIILTLIKKSDRILPKDGPEIQIELEIAAWFHRFTSSLKNFAHEKPFYDPNESFLDGLIKNSRRIQSGNQKRMSDIKYIDRELLGPPRKSFKFLSNFFRPSPV